MNDLFLKNRPLADSESEEEKEIPAVLVSVVTGEGDLMDTDSSLNELGELLATAGGRAYCRLIQSREKPEHATFIGSGKLLELREICQNAGIELVVFDHELSPSQISNIEKVLGEVSVIDRTMLILDIFARNAKTSEGILQVQIANLKYTYPRLLGKGSSLSRLGGGIGTRGPGETKLESDRRIIKKRIQRLEEELSSLSQKRQTQRKKREKSGIFQIAIAGYTNAGKSTLLNLLCHDSILEQDKLFATLDPTTRKLRLPRCGEVLLTDTVGFINRLPHHLVEAFKSTLDEVVFSDLILLVSDSSDAKFLQKLEITERILSELFEKAAIAPVPFLYVLNKADRKESIFNTAEFPPSKNHVIFSAKTGLGKEALLEAIEKELMQAKRKCRFLLPYSESGKLDLLYRTANVLSSEYVQNGIEVEAVCDQKTRGQLSEFMLKE